MPSPGASPSARSPAMPRCSTNPAGAPWRRWSRRSTTNKLWADWHDSTSGKQADRYRALARERLGDPPTRRLGLVLLSQRDGLRAGEHYPLDYVHVSWRDVGQALRRALPPAWYADVGTTLEVWPVIQMLVAIERDLLDLDLTPLREGSAPPMVRIRQLMTLASYLDDR